MLKLYDAVLNHDFAEDTCFLCGATAQGEETKEHVFPKWLLGHFELWNTRINLINGSQIPYRSLVIPCCKDCNNEHLSKIENEIRDGFMAGVAALRSVSRQSLMLWTLKIFYGLLYRELFLPFNRANPKAGPIVEKSDMEQFQLLHYVLQASRTSMQFSQLESDIPASVFVFDLQEPVNRLLRFDYRDDLVGRTLYLRMGSVGILAAFDMGAQTHEGHRFFPQYQNHSLHPVQFEELGANLFMKARKLNRVPKVAISEGVGGVRFSVAPIAGLSMRPVFDDWDSEEMADMLMQFLGYPREVVMPIQGKLATWLRREDGSIWHMKIDSPPWSSSEP
jgi:hypothetical protein